jgi:hypothetical protein
MSGLNLAGGERRIDTPRVITEARAGVSSGELVKIVASKQGSRAVAMESSDEQAALDGGGRWIGYELSELESGVYRASSVDADSKHSTTYFEIEEGEVRRIFGDDERLAQRHARRHAQTRRR